MDIMYNFENDLIITPQPTTAPIDTSLNAETTETTENTNYSLLDGESVFTGLAEKYKETEGVDLPANILETIESYSKDEIQSYLDTISLTSLVRMAKTSAVGVYSGIIGGIIDFFDGDTKDGKIDPTKQGATGDCWLLSGVNALSYTEEGRNMIKDSLEYGDDGLVRVHLKGIESICVITPEEIAATKGSSQYSSGDDDMIIFELAIEKVLDDIAEGRIALDSSAAPWFIEDQSRLSTTTRGKSSTNGGYTNELIYLLTGKVGEYSNDKDKKNEFLDRFQQNGNKDFALGAGLAEEIEVQDANGNNIKLAGHHAYAVKSVNGDTVTITNPWDSSKEIVLPRETFLNNFDLNACDLSENNPTQHFSSKTCKVDKDGNWVYTFNHPESDKGYYGVDYKVQEEIYKNGRLTKSVSKDEDGNVGRVKTYKANGKTDTDNYYDKNGTLKCSYQYNDDGKLITDQRYYDNGVLSAQTNYDKDGNKETKTLYAEDGRKTNEFHFDKDGNMNLETTFASNGNKETETEYAENGNKTAKTQYDEQGRKQVRYEYDEQGHVSREIKYDKDGNIKSISRYRTVTF